MRSDTISTTLAALADPTRRAILARLSTGEANINQLAEPFDMTVQAVSRHIRVLEEAGLISRRREAQSSFCQFEPKRLEAIDGWLERYRPFWMGSFDRMEKLLNAKTGRKNGSKQR